MGRTTPSLATGSIYVRQDVLRTVLHEMFREHERPEAVTALVSSELADLPAEKQADWLVSLIARLDNETAQTDAMLREMCDAIAGRLMTGRWQPQKQEGRGYDDWSCDQ